MSNTNKTITVLDTLRMTEYCGHLEHPNKTEIEHDNAPQYYNNPVSKIYAKSGNVHIVIGGENTKPKIDNITDLINCNYRVEDMLDKPDTSPDATINCIYAVGDTIIIQTTTNSDKLQPKTEFARGCEYMRDTILAHIIGLQNGIGCDTTDPKYQAWQEIYELIKKNYGDMYQSIKGV